jgi:hypothetical protein
MNQNTALAFSVPGRFALRVLLLGRNRTAEALPHMGILGALSCRERAFPVMRGSFRESMAKQPLYDRLLCA